MLAQKCHYLHRFLVRKYWFEDACEVFFATGARVLGYIAWYVGDIFVIDKGGVEGSAKTVRLAGRIGRKVQTGFLQHYLLIMMLGVILAIGSVFLIV